MADPVLVAVDRGIDALGEVAQGLLLDIERRFEAVGRFQLVQQRPEIDAELEAADMRTRLVVDRRDAEDRGAGARDGEALARAGGRG